MEILTQIELGCGGKFVNLSNYSTQSSMIEAGSIVKNLIPGEPVVITKIQQLGSSISLSYTGINSQKSSSKVIKAAQMDKLEVVTEEGSFNFKGDPEKFVLFAEAERINSAYQFERAKRIEALTPIFPKFLTLFALCDCPYSFQKSTCRNAVGIDEKDQLSFRQVLRCKGDYLLCKTAVINPGSEANPVIS